MKKLINKSILLLVVLFCCNQLIQAQELLKPNYKDVSPLRAQPPLTSKYNINNLDTANPNNYFDFLAHNDVSQRSRDPKDNYIQYTYNSPITVSRIKIGLPNLKSPDYDHLRIKEFRIQGSIDGKNWKTLQLKKGQSYNFGGSGRLNILTLNFENSLAFPVKFLRFYLVDTYAKKAFQDWDAGTKVLIGYFLVYGNNIPFDENLRLSINQIPVSKGHATLVVTKDIATTPPKIISSVLIDAGYDNTDAIKIINVINKEAKGRLDRVYITHVDQDHWGGLRTYDPKEKEFNDNKLGILAYRCDATSLGNPYSIFQKNTNKLLIFYNEEEEKSPLFQGKYDNFPIAKIQLNLAQKLWKSDQKHLVLGNSQDGKPILLKTLAVNLEMKSSTSKIETSTLGSGASKNDRSGVIIITWDHFSFLIQGDLQGDPLSNNRNNPALHSEVSRTITSYTSRNNFYNYRELRLPEEYEYNKEKDNPAAKSLTFDQIEAINPELNTGFFRIPLINFNYLTKEQEDKLRKKTPNKVLNILDSDYVMSNKDYIASVDISRHKLAEVIETHNGDSGYGHACIALAPHHGGNTANLWFDTGIAIIGTNNRNEYGHPRPEALRSLYTTSGVRDYYFTYLLNKGGHNRYDFVTNYATKWPNLARYALKYETGKSNGDYIKFEVQTDPINSDFKVYTSSFEYVSNVNSKKLKELERCTRDH
ncbi:hypothetical protein [Aquimarina sp. 2201CG14-23]|uniref:hypothetical protein n=1 Tax=Aquimarina mycalae TaxID=3040073 RepID=UPI002477E0B9|nr:hypothetical protein [Aquimarina sp. 2201CG14-23]MDH7445941.1 hypothetical protein [Aquimarina sp. 2201CG14-23]